MKTDKLSEVVSPEVETSVITFLKDTQTGTLPFLVELSPKERKRLPKLGRKQVDFVDKAYVSAASSPEFLPGYIPLEEFIKDMELRTSLLKMKEELKKLSTKFDDTILLVESEVYRAARVFYSTAKAAASEGEDVANLIVEKLAYHHKKSRTEDNGNGTGDDAGNGTGNGAGEEPVETTTHEA